MIIGHTKQWNFLKNKFESDQLSHAYLFTGENQLGKKTFAKEFVKLINCLAKTDKPCQKCQNCLMIEKGNFPDLLMVENAEGELKIEKLRDAQNFLSYKSYYGSFKAVIINDAEKMNQEAQSCFLKTLEEPKGKTIIILITSRPETLLDTIASRCQTIKFSIAGRAEVLFLNPDKIEKEKNILKEILGVISSDLAEKFKYAKALDLESQGLKDILVVLTKYFRYLLFLKIGAETHKEQKHFIEPSAYFKDYSVSRIKKIINLIEYINRQTSSTNVNQKLALEYLLVEI
ncbi:MAG: DNA polymerase III subunit [bacterium]|nr:DNA polymerase III subunit [bacterium]